MSLVGWIFQAPRPATYTIKSFPNELCWFPSNIPCLWVPYLNSSTIILYLHGNASDLGTDRDFLHRMSQTFGVNVLGIEFPGYGPFISWELPSEERLFQRVKHVCSQLSAMKTVKNIIVMGYSLGSTAAIHLAAHPPCSKVRALILYAPFACLHDLIEDVANNDMLSGTLKHLVSNHSFHNQETISKIQIPIAIFHGNLDQLIPLRHAEQLAGSNPLARLLVQEGMTHDPSATSRTETQLFQDTREFLRDVLFESQTPNPLTWAPIRFPSTYWDPPTAFMDAEEEDNKTNRLRQISVGVGIFVLVVLALFLLRDCTKIEKEGKKNNLTEIGKN